MKLIMRADDLGFSEAVNLGIYKAVKEGVITSVGMMTNMEHANHGYELVKDFDIALGQHTNICAGRPLTDPKLIPSLVQENGEFCSSREIRSRKEDTVVIEPSVTIDACSIIRGNTKIKSGTYIEPFSLIVDGKKIK